MKYQQIALICLIVVICSVNGMDGEARADKSAKGIFQSWKDKHGKHYDNETHEEKKFAIWLNHKNDIDAHNSRFAKGLETYSQELNQNHDKTVEEFLKAFTGAVAPRNGKRDATIISSRAALPASVDLRNILPPIKNQGQCGWKFKLKIENVLKNLFKKNFNL